MDRAFLRVLRRSIAAAPTKPLARNMLSDYLREQGDEVAADYHASLSGLEIGCHALMIPVQKYIWAEEYALSHGEPYWHLPSGRPADGHASLIDVHTVAHRKFVVIVGDDPVREFNRELSRIRVRSFYRRLRPEFPKVTAGYVTPSANSWRRHLGRKHPVQVAMRSHTPDFLPWPGEFGRGMLFQNPDPALERVRPDPRGTLLNDGQSILFPSHRSADAAGLKAYRMWREEKDRG